MNRAPAKAVIKKDSESFIPTTSVLFSESKLRFEQKLPQNES
jgi:hypothetical protein